MKIEVDREDLLRDALQLRRAEDDSAQGTNIAMVRSHLEEELGRVVPRSVAARFLGISQPALDKWIARGDIPTVLSPVGRRMVPVREVIDLAEALGERREQHHDDRYPLASVLRERREKVEELDPEKVLPRRYLRDVDGVGHRRAELRDLAYHRVVAQRLEPRVVRDAWVRLDRWRKAGKIAERYAARWDEILSRPSESIARIISKDTESSRDLRQNSPFTGVLTELERRRVLEVVA